MVKDFEDIISFQTKWMFVGTNVNNYLLLKKPPIKERKIFLRYFFRLLFFTIGSIRITTLYFHQDKSYTAESNRIDHIIGSTQHGYSEDLEYRYKNYFKVFNSEVKKKYIIFDEYNKKQYTKICSISLYDLLQEVNLNAKESSDLISRIDDMNFLKLILPFTIKNLSFFSYFALLFRTLGKHNNALEFFSGGNELVAGAAIKEYIKTNLFKHGLMSKVSKFSLLNYSNIYVYTIDEKKYLEQLGGTTEIQTYQFAQLNKRTSKVIIFGNPVNLTQINELKLISDISIFFSRLNIETIYKCHPSMKKKEQEKISTMLNIMVISKKIDCQELIKELLPMFCFGWRSTGLCESLNSGVIPVTTIQESEISQLDHYDFVYPFHKRTLSWDLDKTLIKEISTKNSEYEKILSKLNG